MNASGWYFFDREATCVHEQVAKRIANVRFTQVVGTCLIRLKRSVVATTLLNLLTCNQPRYT